MKRAIGWAFALAALTVACTGILGIDGNYEGLSTAICTRVNACEPSVNVADCEKSVPSTTDVGAACVDAGDCVAFVNCAAPQVWTCGNANVVGMPCTSTTVGDAGNSCCVCSVTDGGVGVCSVP